MHNLCLSDFKLAFYCRWNLVCFAESEVFVSAALMLLISKVLFFISIINLILHLFQHTQTHKKKGSFLLVCLYFVFAIKSGIRVKFWTHWQLFFVVEGIFYNHIPLGSKLIYINFLG